MPRIATVCALLCGLLVFGCSQKNATVADLNPHYVFEENGAIKENDPVTGNKLVRKAKSAIGTPYVYGGSQPGGFDCSGLVKWAYNSVGVKLPRTAREQSVVGKKVKKIEHMRAGDIVAFHHPRRGYHTGIYLGDGKFVHSPRKRSNVRINSLHEPYFSSTLLGARRVSMDGSENLIAQAEERLRQYVSQKAQTQVASRQALKKTSAKKSVSKTVRHAKASRKTVAEKKSVNLRKAALHKAPKASKSQQKNTRIVAQKDKKQHVASKKTATRAVSMNTKKSAKARGRNS